ncbi:YitT family protein [Floricoccus penangensis]|uniref:YitT family protein n=1 Tax=Floricoccus penangensis TaxID=1859475 RepID=UPI00218BD040|nr:YitT family protein [Floricoccus penangensis]URZ88486.1 YitT family protein [Floricoccus penangensis]
MLDIKNKIWGYVKIIFALLLLAFAINMFLGPHQIAAGGVSGLGILMEYAFGFSRAGVVLVLNIVMLILALVFLGKESFLKVLFGSLAFPVAIAIVPEMMLTSDKLLSVLFGSAIFAYGVSILYNNDSSAGGTTIPPLILQKYFNIDKSVGLLMTDAIVVFLNLVVFGIESFLYAILSIIITSIVMSYIETGTNRKKEILIMSEDKLPAIQQCLNNKIDRGLTFLEAKGGYKNESKQVLMIVVDNQEFLTIKRIIESVDPNAFVIVSNVSEVLGRGFTYTHVE